jgi:hypothetical protein
MLARNTLFIATLFETAAAFGKPKEGNWNPDLAGGVSVIAALGATLGVTTAALGGGAETC